MGTTEIKDNGKIIRTETGFTYLITQEGISSEAIKSDELIKQLEKYSSDHLVNNTRPSRNEGLMTDFKIFIEAKRV